MTIDAGAPVGAEPKWLQADWKRIGTDVKRLQVRIAKATLEGRWGKVKALQHLLTRSHSGKMFAVKRVTENRGKRTPGVDGKILSSPAAKWNGMQSLRHRVHHNKGHCHQIVLVASSVDATPDIGRAGREPEVGRSIVPR
jgi:hypothetical protein